MSWQTHKIHPERAGVAWSRSGHMRCDAFAAIGAADNGAPIDGHHVLINAETGERYEVFVRQTNAPAVDGAGKAVG